MALRIQRVRCVCSSGLRIEISTMPLPSPEQPWQTQWLATTSPRPDGSQHLACQHHERRYRSIERRGGVHCSYVRDESSSPTLVKSTWPPQRERSALFIAETTPRTVRAVDDALGGCARCSIQLNTDSRGLVLCPSLACYLRRERRVSLQGAQNLT